MGVVRYTNDGQWPEKGPQGRPVTAKEFHFILKGQCLDWKRVMPQPLAAQSALIFGGSDCPSFWQIQLPQFVCLFWRFFGRLQIFPRLENIFVAYNNMPRIERHFCGIPQNAAYWKTFLWHTPD